MKLVYFFEKASKARSSLMAQWVKDLALSLLGLWLQLWLGFDPRLRNFHVLQMWPKNKQKKTLTIEGIDYPNSPRFISEVEFIV